MANGPTQARNFLAQQVRSELQRRLEFALGGVTLLHRRSGRSDFTMPQTSEIGTDELEHSIRFDRNIELEETTAPIIRSLVDEIIRHYSMRPNVRTIRQLTKTVSAVAANLGSGLIDYSQKMTMAAMQIADMNV